MLIGKLNEHIILCDMMWNEAVCKNIIRYINFIAKLFHTSLWGFSVYNKMSHENYKIYWLIVTQSKLHKNLLIFYWVFTQKLYNFALEVLPKFYDNFHNTEIYFIFGVIINIRLQRTIFFFFQYSRYFCNSVPHHIGLDSHQKITLISVMRKFKISQIWIRKRWRKPYNLNNTYF